MKERDLNFKNKSAYSYFGMINALRVNIWILGENVNPLPRWLRYECLSFWRSWGT